VSETVVVGVDLGGTNVRAGAFYEDGTPAGEKFDRPSRAQSGTRAVVESIVAVVNQALAHAAKPPVAVGMAVPGHIDSLGGRVRWSPNFGEEVGGLFQSWRDVPLREMLAHSIGVPIFMGNDANLAALGEYRFGTGQNNAKCLVMFTIGTGIGGGVVMGRDSVFGDARGPMLLLGGNQGGGELGHMIISREGLDCNAGTYGPIEAYCQRDSIVKRAQYRILRGRKTMLMELADGDASAITPKMIADAAAQGDELSLQIWSEVGGFLGVGVANAINVFAPDIVAIGGQIAKAGDVLLNPVRAAARDAAIPSLFEDAKIVQAELIEDAGLRGGAALALEGASRA
jgi:glucokinase